MTHTLKTWPRYYKAIENDSKRFEVRRFDRPFKVGDILILQEYIETTKEYTGKELQRKVDYILPGNTAFGVFGDFCIMSLSKI